MLLTPLPSPLCTWLAKYFLKKNGFSPSLFLIIYEFISRCIINVKYLHDSLNFDAAGHPALTFVSSPVTGLVPSKVGLAQRFLKSKGPR